MIVESARINCDMSISLNTIDNTPSRSERRDAVENRQRILITAENLFAERGVADVNMADIAKAAGVGKGTLYRRFASKAELCLALMDTQMAEFQNVMLDRMRQLTAQDVPQLDQLDQFLDALVQFTDVHSPLLCVVQSEGLTTEMNVQRPHFWQFMTVRGLLQTAVSTGELPATVDVDYVADALLAPLHASIFRFQRQVRGFSLERISAGLRGIVRGLANG